MQRIAVIGGGAKAAALASKAACIRDCAGLDIQIVVFEKNVFGANWSGKYGYTDGQQQLCTPAERDVGFPYRLDTFGPEIAEDMQRRFSWMAYLLRNGIYSNWVNRGQPKPSHEEFAAYLNDCILTSGVRPVFGTVTHVARSKGRWSITYDDRTTGAQAREKGFDGVVVTGPGPATNTLPTIVDPRVLDGVSFWQSLPSVKATLAGSDGPVLIVGSGGTAAAIAGWFAASGAENEVVVLGSQPTMFARVDSVFENIGFENQDIWNSLSAADRARFTDRLTRGTVWQSVLDRLARAPNVKFFPGKTRGIRYEPPGDPAGDVMVDFRTSADPSIPRSREGILVIDARGFDAFWFTSLLAPTLAKRILRNPSRMRDELSGSLELPLKSHPGFHVPGISQALSPSFTSLMALGDLSDAILAPYVRNALS